MIVAVDLNASPVPEDDQDDFGDQVEEYHAPEERVESAVDIARREREERKRKLKRERSDDKPVQVSQSPGHDQLFHTKILKSYDRSKLPPGWLDCPSFGQEIYCMIPSKVPLGESFNDYIIPGKRYSFKQVIHQQRVLGRKLGLVIDLTNTSRYYPVADLKKEGIKHVKIQCKGRNSVPDNLSVNHFVYEVTQFLFRQKHSRKYILVHCTHGHNRTGYMIIHYLMRTMSMSVTQAIKIFSDVRPPGIYKPEYIDALYAFYHEKKPEMIVCPPTPKWKRTPELVDLNGEAMPDDDDDDGVPGSPLHETKKDNIDKTLCQAIWGSDEVMWEMQPANNSAGGILCMWTETAFKLQNKVIGNGFIFLEGECIRERILWDSVRQLKQASQVRLWCVLGDFNCIRNPNERSGKTDRLLGDNSMQEFNEWIEDMEVLEVPTVGRQYTWFRPNDESKSRLDRALISPEWRDTWPESVQFTLSRKFSDHCPILIKANNVDWGPKPFRILNCWLTDKSFREVIWNKEEYGDSFKKVQHLEVELNKLEEDTLHRQMTHLEISRRKKLQEDLWVAAQAHEALLRQKSRSRWLKEGDCNTRFFHIRVNANRNRNFIKGLLIEGEWTYEPNKVKEEIRTFFSKRFQEANFQRPKIDGISFKTIDQQQNSMLAEGLRIKRWRYWWMAVTWAIWKLRNRILFSNAEFDANRLFDEAVFLTWTWLRHFEKHFSTHLNQWSSNISQVAPTGT
ncbi:mRNA-capping enzyme [Glycine max]|nr:mRNA-capping enzyme [Glycine max]